MIKNIFNVILSIIVSIFLYVLFVSVSALIFLSDFLPKYFLGLKYQNIFSAILAICFFFTSILSYIFITYLMIKIKIKLRIYNENIFRLENSFSIISSLVLLILWYFSLIGK